MKLYGSFTSPYVRHVRIALLETDLDCEFIETDAKASAEQSPTKKVPFLKDDDIELSDSTSILRYIREKSGQAFLPTVQGLDLFCLVNTLLDSTINLFLLHRFGLESLDNPYLKRQQARITEGLEYLDSLNLHSQPIDRDVKLRLLCFLTWGLYRQRFSIAGLDSLKTLLKEAEQPLFIDTQYEQSLRRKVGCTTNATDIVWLGGLMVFGLRRKS